jgi:hypothetical protein
MLYFVLGGVQVCSVRQLHNYTLGRNAYIDLFVKEIQQERSHLVQLMPVNVDLKNNIKRQNLKDSDDGLQLSESLCLWTLSIISETE